MSVGSSVAEELTFPEFIECLFRCSGRFFSLRRHHDGGEAQDVADKFEALVMAMDGHGSVLQKHSIADPAAQLERLDRVQKGAQLARPTRLRPKAAAAPPYVYQPSPLDAVYRPPPRVEVPIMEKALRNAQLKFLRGKYPAI